MVTIRDKVAVRDGKLVSESVAKNFLSPSQPVSQKPKVMKKQWNWSLWFGFLAVSPV